MARSFYQRHIAWRIFNSSRPMRCSTGLEMSKTANTSAIALLAMAKITRSWSVKSMVPPPMLVTAAKAAVVRFSDSAGVLVPKCDGRSSEPAATWAFLPRVLKPVHDPSMSERIRGGLCSLSDIRSSENSSWRHVCPMSNDHERNEFGLLLGQFHAVVRGGSDSIEGIFDAEFRRRFSELINRVAELDRPDPADLRKFHQ